MTMLPILFKLTFLLLKNSAFVMNTDSVTLVLLALSSKLLGRESDPVGLLLLIMLNKRAFLSICWAEKFPRTALKLSPLNVSESTFCTDTANVVCVTRADVSFSGIGMLSLTLSKASSSLQNVNNFLNITIIIIMCSVRTYLAELLAIVWLSCRTSGSALTMLSTTLRKFSDSFDSWNAYNYYNER